MTSPAQIGTDTDWSLVEAGWFHILAIKTNGTLWSWGIDNDGEVGNGSSNSFNITAPERITQSSNWGKIAAGENHSFAIGTSE